MDWVDQISSAEIHAEFLFSFIQSPSLSKHGQHACDVLLLVWIFSFTSKLKIQSSFL